MKPFERHPLTERQRRALVICKTALQAAGYSNFEVGKILKVPYITIYKWGQMFADPENMRMVARERAKQYRQQRRQNRLAAGG